MSVQLGRAWKVRRGVTNRDSRTGKMPTSRGTPERKMMRESDRETIGTTGTPVPRPQRPNRRWLVEDLRSLAPPVLSPRKPGDRQPSDPSRRTQPGGSPTRGFWCKETKSPNVGKETGRGQLTVELRRCGDTCPIGIYRSLPVFGTAPSQRETENEITTHQPAPGTDKARPPAPSQTSDSHQQAQPSATGEFGSWPDIPPTWELERDAHGRSETKTQLSIAGSWVDCPLVRPDKPLACWSHVPTPVMRACPAGGPGEPFLHG